MQEDEELTPTQAANIQGLAQRTGVLLIWTVTTKTKDFGDRFVARPHWIGNHGGRSSGAMACYLIADTLGALHEMLPPGLTQLDRQAGDEAMIVETWL